MSAGETLRLLVLSPEKVLLEKAVSNVELPGEKGRFTVLKNHAPLISSLEEGDVAWKDGNGSAKIHIRSGFVEINENNVTVCAEI